jgi:IS4 transposase
MNKHNTILGQMLQLISRSRFEKMVKEYKTEHGAKGLRSWTQFVSMLFGQISNQHGLRSIEQGMNSQKNGWYHMGITSKEREIKRSTLSYANARRDSNLFNALFENLLEEVQPLKEKHGFKFKNPLYSIDSTIIDLCLKLFPWADFRKGKSGIKLTVKLDHQGKIPCFAVVSNALEHDSRKLKDVPYNPGDVLVFDRGFVNYSYFEALCKEKVWFVTRLKSNAVYKRVKKNAVKVGGNIISDYEIIIPSLSTELTFRKIIVRDPETKKKVVLLTNNLIWSSATISSVYKDRWQIELFFKALKQNLKIKRFYGNSKNAVMSQIWIALVAYLMFYILKMKSRNITLSFTNFISVIKTMLFHRTSIYDFLSGSSPPEKHLSLFHRNLEFVW